MLRRIFQASRRFLDDGQDTIAVFRDPPDVAARFFVHLRMTVQYEGEKRRAIFIHLVQETWWNCCFIDGAPVVIGFANLGSDLEIFCFRLGALVFVPMCLAKCSAKLECVVDREKWQRGKQAFQMLQA